MSLGPPIDTDDFGVVETVLIWIGWYVGTAVGTVNDYMGSDDD